MTSLPEQLTAARTAQLEAQFALFHSVTKQAFDNASRVLALNLSASRESAERSSQAVRELFSATGPQDLLALRAHAEEQFRSLFSYGRELFSIASGAQAQALRSSAPPAILPAPAPEAVPEPAANPSGQLAAYVQEHTGSQEPAVLAETAEAVGEPAPVAEPKPIVKAAGKGAPRAAVLPHPLSAPVVENAAVPLPKIEPAPAQGAGAPNKRRK